MGRVRQVAVGSAAASLTTAAFGAMPADAANCVEAGFTNYHAGASQTNVAYNVGASATIEYNPLVLCFPTDNTSGANAWSMAHSWDGDGVGDDDGWAQAGYYRGSWQSGQHFWSQTKECDACPQVDTFLPNGPSVTHSYKVVYNSAAHRYDLYWDTNLISSTDWNPVQTWSGFIQSQYYGEVFDHGDDIPGTASDVTSVTNIKSQNLVTGWGTPPNLNRNNPVYPYYVWKWGNSSIDFWTSR